MIDSINNADCHKALDQFRNYISSKYASDSLIASDYLRIASDFERFLNESNSLPASEAIKVYYLQIAGVPAFEKPSIKARERKARVLLIINDILAGDKPRRKYCYHTTPCPKSFENDMKSYEDLMLANAKSEGTVRTRCGRMKVFFLYLDNVGNKSLEEITPETLCSFISSLNGKYSSQGKASILYTLRNFFSYEVFLKRMSFDPMLFLTAVHSRKHERLESFFSAEEIQSVMNTVNRDSKWGKTVYLMMLLACVYGLRSSDIRELRLDAINWHEKTIALNQWKTKRFVSLPLTDEVTFALLDYIKNARPVSPYQQVFIRLRQPHEPYSKHDHFANKISEFFKKAGVNTNGKHHGLHSMRHSLATGLLSDEVPVNEIAVILGHSSVASTKAYIWSDIKHLRSAALEVPSYD